MTREIIPSLPALTFQEFEQKVMSVCGAVDTFQIDVADGLFVPSRSWPMNPGDRPYFEALLKGRERLPCADKLAFEVHFMAHHPEKLLAEWAHIGIVRALFHIEARHDFAALRHVASTHDLELGVSLKIGTSLERLAPYMPHITVVQVMGIDPIGVQGQPFDERCIPMIEEIRAAYPSVIISVDGAVNGETAPRLLAAGATRLAPGSYVFRSSNPHHAIATLQLL